MKKIYIASPYTLGDKEYNVRRQIECADILMDKNFCIFTPLLSHYHNQIFERSYESWMKQDFEWIKVCDGLIRLSGESIGADLEVQFAKDNNIPVFYSINECINYFKIL